MTGLEDRNERTGIPKRLYVCYNKSHPEELMAHRESPTGENWLLTFECLDDCLQEMTMAEKALGESYTWAKVDGDDLDMRSGLGIKHKSALIRAAEYIPF